MTFSHRWLKLEITKPEIKANCDDLKVLGKGDFKAILKWRTNLREDVRVAYNAGCILANTILSSAWTTSQRTPKN